MFDSRHLHRQRSSTRAASYCRNRNCLPILIPVPACFLPPCTKPCTVGGNNHEPTPASRSFSPGLPTRRWQQLRYLVVLCTVNGNRRRFSLGTSSKTAARALLKEKLVTGTLLPKISSPHRFADFTTRMFLWEHCPLTARKRLRGDRISPHWVNQNRAYLVRHLLPVFGHQLLTDLPRS